MAKTRQNRTKKSSFECSNGRHAHSFYTGKVVCTKRSLLILHYPNVSFSFVEIVYTETNAALAISIKPLNKAIFSLVGLEFCQNLKNCMLNW